MNDLKPVLYVSREDFAAAQNTKDEYAMCGCYLSRNFVVFKHDDFVALQAIPSTHRVVSVADLEMWEKALRYERFANRADEVRAIIDNKEQSE